MVAWVPLLLGAQVASGALSSLASSSSAKKRLRQAKAQAARTSTIQNVQFSEAQRLATLQHEQNKKAATGAETAIRASQAGAVSNAAAGFASALGGLKAGMAGSGRLGTSAYDAALRGMSADVARTVADISSSHASALAHTKLGGAQLIGNSSAALANILGKKADVAGQYGNTMIDLISQVDDSVTTPDLSPWAYLLMLSKMTNANAQTPSSSSAKT